MVTKKLVLDTPDDPPVVDGCQELVALVNELAEKVNSTRSQHTADMPQDVELSVSDKVHIGFNDITISVFNGVGDAPINLAFPSKVSTVLT